MSAAASWRWYLTDASNNPVTMLDEVTSRQTVFKRNYYAESTATMLHSDPDAYKLFDLLFTQNQIPRLQAWRTSAAENAQPVCQFCGSWVPSSEDLAESATISLTFRSPFYTLFGDGSTRGRYTSASDVFTATPSSDIASSLLTSYGSGSGLAVGDLDIGGASAAQTITYANNNVGQSIIDLTNVADSFDFLERYSPDIPSGRMAYLDTYTEFGTDRSQRVRFEYGAGTLNNVTEATRQLDYPANSIVVIGASGLIGTANDSDSITAYGLWPLMVSATQITDQTTLDNIASTYLRPKPIKTIGFSPQLWLPNCPAPFDDFNLGDTVMFSGVRDSFSEIAVPVQINGFTIAVDDSGNETMTVDDPLDPDGEATTNAQIMCEVLEAS